jgi:hypothetical protein
MFKVNVKAGNNYGEMRKIWLFIVYLVKKEILLKW